MKCECGYEGRPEFGKFKDGIYETNIRCPQCKSLAGSMVDVVEMIETELRCPSTCFGSPDFGEHKPMQKTVMILEKGYSIYCPICTWGHGGGLNIEESKKLLKLQRQLDKDWDSIGEDCRCKYLGLGEGYCKNSYSCKCEGCSHNQLLMGMTKAGLTKDCYELD